MDNPTKVLIAEDEEINFLYAEEVLKCLENIIVIHALNGEEAVQQVKDNSDIRLILMDLKMPVLNGFEATRMIKKIRPEIPIIAQTAYSMTKDEDHAKEAGCDCFITKPIKKDEFLSVIKSFL